MKVLDPWLCGLSAISGSTERLYVSFFMLSPCESWVSSLDVTLPCPLVPGFGCRPSCLLPCPACTGPIFLFWIVTPLPATSLPALLPVLQPKSPLCPDKPPCSTPHPSHSSLFPASSVRHKPPSVTGLESPRPRPPTFRSPDGEPALPHYPSPAASLPRYLPASLPSVTWGLLLPWPQACPASLPIPRPRACAAPCPTPPPPAPGLRCLPPTQPSALHPGPPGRHRSCASRPLRIVAASAIVLPCCSLYIKRLFGSKPALQPRHVASFFLFRVFCVNRTKSCIVVPKRNAQAFWLKVRQRLARSDQWHHDGSVFHNK